MSGREAVFQNMVQRMLHACQALGGIIILVMDVQIVMCIRDRGLIKRIIEISRRPEFLGKIIFLENYDM